MLKFEKSIFLWFEFLSCSFVHACGKYRWSVKDLVSLLILRTLFKLFVSPNIAIKSIPVITSLNFVEEMK